MPLAATAQGGEQGGGRHRALYDGQQAECEEAVWRVPPEGGNEEVERESGEQRGNGAKQKKSEEAVGVIARLAQLNGGELGAVIKSAGENGRTGLQAAEPGERSGFNGVVHECEDGRILRRGSGETAADEETDDRANGDGGADSLIWMGANVVVSLTNFFVSAFTGALVDVGALVQGGAHAVAEFGNLIFGDIARTRECLFGIVEEGFEIIDGLAGGVIGSGGAHDIIWIDG
jgi:hypothetical protein